MSTIITTDVNLPAVTDVLAQMDEQLAGLESLLRAELPKPRRRRPASFELGVVEEVKDGE
jgi:hypothetical protein